MKMYLSRISEIKGEHQMLNAAAEFAISLCCLPENSWLFSFIFQLKSVFWRIAAERRTHKLMTDCAFSFISSLLGKQARLTTCLKLKSVAVVWVRILSMLHLEMKMEPSRYSVLVLEAVAGAVYLELIIYLALHCTPVHQTDLLWSSSNYSVDWPSQPG